MDQEIKTFLGRGWSFPPSFDRLDFASQMAPGLTDIEESIHIILGTTPGERIMQPEFGCHIKRVVFEKVNISLVTELNHIIGYALLQFEPRIKFSHVEMLNDTGEDGVVYLRINYTVVITNTRHNIVYPFYLAEGTNVSI